MGLAAIVFPATAGESSVEMDVRLYVGNLPKVTTEDELKALFSQAGTVTAVEVIKERGTNQSKGFAFVTMPDEAESEKAISMFNSYAIGENQLKVNVAKPRTQPA
jgi:RNA recognition motif-containing protein